MLEFWILFTNLTLTFFHKYWFWNWNILLIITYTLITYILILHSSEFSQALVRLTKMIRGIGDPLVAVYARTYICRVSDWKVAVEPELIPVSIKLSDQTALEILFPLDRIHFHCSLLLFIMSGFSQCSREPISFTSGWRQAVSECLIQEHDIVTPAGT